MKSILLANALASIEKSVQMFTALDRRASTAIDTERQTQLIQPEFWPTSSTTTEYSIVGHKNLILTSLLKTSGHL